MTGLNKIGLNQVQLNRLYLNAPFPVYRKMAGGGSSGDGFPVLPGDVTRWHFGGLTNEMMAAMDDPRIEDADGKGRFLSFKNFLWAGMSGVGGYQYNFFGAGWSASAVQLSELSDHRIIIANKKNAVQLSYTTNLGRIKITLKVTGIEANNSIFRVYDNVSAERKQDYTKDGIYEIDYTANEGANIIYFYMLNGNIGALDVPITIEQLPLYPGFILGDGVDDFAVTEKELNFEDTYTVYTAFIPFQDDPARTMSLCGKDRLKDFYMYYSSLYSIGFFSVDKSVSTLLSNGFNLMVCKKTSDKMLIKNLITGKVAEVSVDDLIYNPGLYYLWRSATIANYSKTAIAGQVICNGHFTTDEEDEKVLNWHKKQYPWLFPDQAWTVTGKTNEDTDRVTIANITGNGNNLVLSNFGFAENSGYGLYNVQKFTNWVYVTERGNIVKNGYYVTITNSKITGTSTNYNTDILYSYNYPATITFKVTGLVDGQKIFLGRKSATDAYVIDKDGIYHSDYNIPQEDGRVIVGIGTVGFTGECNITIEQIPDYEGYLVTDGVDDKIQSSNNVVLDEKWTVVGDWALLKPTTSVPAGIAIPNSFFAYNYAAGVAVYINRGDNGIILNNIRAAEAICSDGRIYSDNWTELIDNTEQKIFQSKTPVYIGHRGESYTKIAFKNLAIYGVVLSKEDCIKAYNYLQTLKAK